jgi:hypothetical protein
MVTQRRRPWLESVVKFCGGGGGEIYIYNTGETEVLYQFIFFQTVFIDMIMRPLNHWHSILKQMLEFSNFCFLQNMIWAQLHGYTLH